MIEFLDLKKENAPYMKSLFSAAEEVIQSGRYLFGGQVEAFQKDLADYQDIPYAVGVGNGLDALKLILKGYMELGVMNRGDEVIVPSNTFIATFLAVSACGLTPIPVDPNLETFNLTPEGVIPKLTSKTKAIILVHLYGRIAWSKEWVRLSKKHNLKLIEDNAQAFGAQRQDRKSGSLGDAAAFSFFPAKNLGALGDAGAVVTEDPQLAGMVKALSNYGLQSSGTYPVKGENSRLDELQAAFLRIKLKDVDSSNEKRRKIAEIYLEQIKHPELCLPLRLPVGQRESHVWHLFTVRSSKRDQLINDLSKKGIQTHIHYPIAPHQQQAYSSNAWDNFPVAEKIHKEILSLPCRPSLNEGEMDHIIQSINAFPG
jgi:dTDP-4-amino-4,6-dideoxygalactose transaminase